MSTTVATSAPVGRAADARVAAVVPPQPEQAVSGWRRLIRAVDQTRRGAFALDGPSLEAGVAYDLPEGAVIVAVDRFTDRYHIRMMRAALGGLETVKEWETKSPLGKRVVDYVARRLPESAGIHRYTRLDVLPNRWASWCRTCRGPVAPRQGRVVHSGGRNIVIHHPGQCPPPPEVVTPNRYPGLCFACGGWVAAWEGSAIRRTSPREGGGMYEPMHGTPDGGRCPDNPIPGPPNEVPGWCADCMELVPSGKGYWMDNRLRHVACPDERLGVPTWIARAAGNARLRPGDVARVRLEVGPGDPPVPESAPGWRILGDGYVEMVAVVVETVQGRTGRVRARVRAATPAEAEEVLAREVRLVPDVRPHAEGFKARYIAEKIGHERPWLAEITGRDPRHGYQRVFLRADRDYSKANSKGTRGVMYGWTLAVNRVYEAKRWLSWTKWERVFLRATPEGDVVEITQEEVEAWLDHAPVWTAS